MDNLEEIEKFLEIYKQTRLNHEVIEHLREQIVIKEVESIIKYLPTKKNPGPDGFTGEFYQIFKELMPVLLKLFKKVKEEGRLPNSFYKASITLIPKADKYKRKIIDQYL